MGQSSVAIETDFVALVSDHADGSSDHAANGAAAARTTEERYLALLGPLQFGESGLGLGSKAVGHGGRVLGQISGARLWRKWSKI